MNERVRPWTIAGLVVVFAGPELFAWVPRRLFGPSPGVPLQFLVHLLYRLLPVFIVWVVLRKERLSLRSIGLARPTWVTLLSGLLLWAAGFVILPFLTAPLLGALGTNGLRQGMAELAAMPMWFRVFVAITGGIVEETLYRGYAVERLAAATGRRWLGAAMATVAFGLAHVPAWGWGFALGADLPLGIYMTLFYLWRRDLGANIIAHSVGLTVAMFTIVP